MRVTGAAEVFGASAEFHDRRGFRNQLGSGMLQNVRAQNPVGLCFRHKLDHALGIFVGERAPVRAERELADSDFDSLLFRLVLRQTNSRQLGVRVDNRGNHVVVHMP